MAALFGSKKNKSEKILEDVDEYIRNGNELLKQGEKEEANSMFRRGRILLQKFDTSDLPEQTANRYTRIAYGIMETGDDEIAMECAEKALEFNQNEIDAYLVKGAIYLKRTRMYNQAILAFNDALKINPKHEKALELKAGALERRKQLKKAYQLYKQLAEISDNPEKYKARMAAIKKKIALKRAGARTAGEAKEVTVTMKPKEGAEEPSPAAQASEVGEVKPEPEITPPPETAPASEVPEEAAPEPQPEPEAQKVDDVLEDVLESVGANAISRESVPEAEEGAPAAEPEDMPEAEPAPEPKVVEEAPEPQPEEVEEAPPAAEEAAVAEEMPAPGPEEPEEEETVEPIPEPVQEVTEEAEIEGAEAVEAPEPQPEKVEEATPAAEEATAAEEMRAPEPEEPEEEAVEIDVEVVRKEANAAFEEDDFEKAVELYEQLAAAGENDIDLYYNLGVCYYSIGRLEDAVAVFDAILEADPTDTDSWLTKGAAHFSLGEYDRAIDAFNNVLKRNVNEDAAWYYKACSEALRGNGKLALTFLERAISLDENYKEIAPEDESFASVKDDPKFKEIVAQ